MNQGEFLSTLEVEQVEDSSEEGRGSWRLLSPLIYKSADGVTYTVPTGFVTDFASVPRVPIVFDELGDRGNLAATLHDWLYTVDPKTGAHPVQTRLEADELLREAAIAQGVSSFDAEILFLGVRVGGRSHW